MHLIALFWGFLLSSFVSSQTALTRPSCPVNPVDGFQRVVGYYETWARDRPAKIGRFYPNSIPYGVYTHKILAFVGIDPEAFEIVPASQWDMHTYRQINDYTFFDLSMKTMVSIGGWNFNNEGPTSGTFSKLAGDITAQRKFFKSLISFLSTYNLNGVDINWQFPGAANRGGRPEDYENFTKFMSRLRRALPSEDGYEISVTLPAAARYLKQYDVKGLEANVDFFNFMSYDLHGDPGKSFEEDESVLNAHTNLTEIETSLDQLWSQGVSPNKVTLGLAFHGRGFTAADSNCVEPGCPFESASPIVWSSDRVGIIANYDIKLLLEREDVVSTYDEKAAVNILKYDADKWATYDDHDSLLAKANYARSRCMGGVHVWAASQDACAEPLRLGCGIYSQIVGRVAKRRFGPVEDRDWVEDLSMDCITPECRGEDISEHERIGDSHTAKAKDSSQKEKADTASLEKPQNPLDSKQRGLHI